MPARGDGVGGRPVTLTGVARTLVLLNLHQTLTGGVSAALCPTPQSQPLSRVTLLEPGSGTQLDWRPAPEGTLARYSCDPGYLPVGGTERRCTADGVWTGTAPHCYLNVASQSSLAAWPALVDDNLTTHIKLTELDGVDVNIYYVPPTESEPTRLSGVREIRLISGGEHDLQERKMVISTVPSLGDRCDEEGLLSKAEVQQTKQKKRTYPVEGKRLWIHTFLIPTKTCFEKIEIRKSGKTIKTDSSLPAALVYEMQLVTESTGASRHQCRLPTGSDDPPETSWAVGELCYHLFRSRLPHSAAGQRCRQLGSDGQLLQLGDSASLRYLLRQQSTINSWSEEFIWKAKVRRGREDTHNTDVPKEVNETEMVRKPGKESCPGLQQIMKWHIARTPCEEKRMFICQTAPSQCGSPAVAAGLRYDPAPRPSLLAANVTCAGHRDASGTVLCRRRRWSQPDFCHATGGVLGVALGALAAVLLLLGCILLGVASFMRHKRENEGGWETYTYIRRLSRLSRYGGRQQGLAVDLMADHTYSEPVSRTGSEPPGSLQGPPSSWPGRRGTAELPPPPPPTSSPPSSAGLVNPHRPPPPPAAGSSLPAVEYCVPLVQGRRHSPKLSFVGRPRDEPAVASGEYAVPYDSRRQEVSDCGGVPPDVVASTAL